MNLTETELATLADDLVESHDQLLEKLVKARRDHRLTQADVAEMMGVSQPTVAAFERYDANPTLSTIRRYALAVGASIQHDVQDACCGLGVADAFQAVVAPTMPWRANVGVAWETWSTGPVVAKAIVGA